MKKPSLPVARFECPGCQRETTWKYTGMGIAARCQRCGLVKLLTDFVRR